MRTADRSEDADAAAPPEIVDLLDALCNAANGRPGHAPSLDRPGFITPQWAYGDGRAEGVRVAIVDSGVEGGHPLVGTIAESVVVEIDRDAEDGYRVSPDEARDLYGHGTACAGIIRELAPGVELHSARVLGEQLTGRARCFAGALEWAIESGMQVVNLSLSTTNEDWYESFMDLANRALRHRVMLVGALSNEPKVSIPSEFASVFSVAAVEGDDRERFLADPELPTEWGAPGVDVEVAWLGGSTVTVTGNSFAAPVIAALVARIVATHPGVSCWQVKTILAELAAADPEPAVQGRTAISSSAGETRRKRPAKTSGAGER